MKVATLHCSFLRRQKFFSFFLLHWGFYYNKNGGEVCTVRWIYHENFSSDSANTQLAPHSFIYTRKSDLRDVLIFPSI